MVPPRDEYRGYGSTLATPALTANLQVAKGARQASESGVRDSFSLAGKM